ncbi:protein FAM210B, mitochondrial-like [Pollicipes pollicipes]|uniref:protein FAM210B, mitochondrial-like n=1 Tax=Pollicipes pollicipes TaxID=41117 RepID=UPI0018858BD3|nr:protein FAM210B, mitochondrial-like [Pollicipes pollicipes]XP_037078386.1 protein FAM210B, mitochondrial-like [Pollicipes pollicipes]XP_037078388.1 protein FAM210B, mitochondrial-like [Pollicipes pollicipes]XP_037078389.1 protein FAM210B, mitochondrial-like [Pollicipes pollicipes]XP_037078390.1 protein FAM210B, mitochondrial-like [Pollicipes pollicipes]
MMAQALHTLIGHYCKSALIILPCSQNVRNHITINKGLRLLACGRHLPARLVTGTSPALARPGVASPAGARAVSGAPWPPTSAALHTSVPRPDLDPPTPSQRQRLKLAVRDYGGTVIVFHVTISLASLGFFYLAVKSGLDVVGLLRWVGLGDSLAQSKLVTGGSTFVLAYAVHKVFAPARIATTLACTPFIVRSLRRRGLLKTPPPRSD